MKMRTKMIIAMTVETTPMVMMRQTVLVVAVLIMDNEGCGDKSGGDEDDA